MPSPVDLHVGRRLRLRRRALEISQQALADRVGITFQQIQKYEWGTNRVSASRLYDIAKALGVAPAHFFEGLPLVPSEMDPDNDRMNDPLTLEVVSAFYGISSRSIRAKALALLGSLPGRSHRRTEDKEGGTDPDSDPDTP